MSLKTLKLGEICLVRRGTTITKKQTIEGDVPVIGGGTKPTYFHNESNRMAGCITVSGSGASAGFVNRWDVPIFASDCSTVEPKDDTQLSKFIYYYLMSQQQFIYDNFRSGAAQPHVYSKDIEKLNYPVLTIAEQQRIVAKLDAAFAEIDEQIKQTKLKAEYIELMSKSFIQNIFSNELNTYSTTFLKDLCNNYKKDIVDGPFGSNLKSEHFTDDGVRVLKIQNIKENRINNKNISFISNRKYLELKRHSFIKGDIIMTKLGAPLGVSALVEDIEYGVIVADLVRIRVDKINRKFLLYQLNSIKIRNYINSMQKGTTRPRVRLNIVRELPIILPDIKKQNEIVEKIEIFFSNYEIIFINTKKKVENYNSLKKSILNKLVNNYEAA